MVLLECLNYSANTARCYLRVVQDFARYFQQAPDLQLSLAKLARSPAASTGCNSFTVPICAAIAGAVFRSAKTAAEAGCDMFASTIYMWTVK